MQKLKIEQLAIGNYHYTNWPFEHFLKSVQELGLKNIEIWGAKPHFLVDIQSPDYLRTTAKKIQDAGLNVICFCPEQNNYPVNISASETSLRRWSIEHMKHSIEAAALLGAPTVLLCPGNGTMDEQPEAIRDRFAVSARELSQTAADNGVMSHVHTWWESILGLNVKAVQGKPVRLEWTDTSGGLLEWWHDPGVPLAFPVESASS